METARGLVISCLRTTGRKVYSINPMAVARYRERHRVTRAKSDHADAMALANILRTDAQAHRPLPADSELVQAITVLARAQQDAVWNRGQPVNQLRSHLKQYFPAALTAFQVRGAGLDSREARAVLAVAPDPATAAKLSQTRLQAVLRKAGRQRYIDVRAERLRGVFAGEQLRQLPLVEQAMGRQTQALILQLDAACRAAGELAAATAEAFAQHPDAEILTSFPGIGPLTGARVLGEIGDDRTRFDSARGLKSYSGSAPAARALSCTSAKSRTSGSRPPVMPRVFGALPCPQIKMHYDRLCEAGDKHAAALRNLFNRFLGCLYHCLHACESFDIDKAFPARAVQPEPVAA